MIDSLISFSLTCLTIYGFGQLIIKYNRWKKTGIKKVWKIYSQGGEWFFFKRWAMYIILRLKRWKEQRQKGNVSNLLYNREFAKKCRESEKPQKLKDGPHAIDSVYFYGGNEKKLSFILRFARRHKRCGELWFLLRLPDGRHFQHMGYPDTQVYNCNPNEFQVDGLRIFCEEPMQRWRVIYSGFMRESGHPDSFVPISFNACFRSFTNVFDVEQDLSHHLIAEALAREPWSREFFDRLQNEHDDQEHLEQWGAFTGSLQVEDKSFELDLRGYRDHSYGTRNWEQYYRYAAHFGHFEDGSSVSVGSVCLPRTTTHIRYGYYYTSYGAKWPITSHNFNLWERGEAIKTESQYKLRFVANGKTFVLRLHTDRNFTFLVGEQATNKIIERFANYTLNGIPGHGVSEYCYQDYTTPNVEREQSLPHLCDRTLTPSDPRPNTLLFKNELCQASSLTGGKGSQLALLATIDGIAVPEGFVVTTNAYRSTIQKAEDLSKTIKKLRSCNEGSELEKTQQAIQEKFNPELLTHELKEEIDAAAREAFGDDFSQSRFAVRSSAVGEDAEDASSAGQMETFLGIPDNELGSAIVRCWASQFNPTAVAYRRQHGLGLDPNMAVVIQRMVSADAAGVLFTQHPVTGSGNHLSIDANYGLGESVVSATCDPDTFTVARFTDTRYEITERKIGGKKTRVQMKDTGGVEEQSTGEEQNKSCLTDEQILRLAQYGRLIEKHFGNPRDIEWAIVGDDISFLQARAITTSGLMGEDLMHEFDSSMPHDNEWVTTANVGEMMPGAVTPLTGSIFGRAIDVALQSGFRSAGLLFEVNNVQRLVPSFCNHLFININTLGCLTQLHLATSDLKMLYLALLGRVVDRPTLDELRKYNGSSGFPKRVVNFVRSMLDKFLSSKATHGWERRLADGYSILERYTAADQLEAIDVKIDDYYRCWSDTVSNSSNSAIGSMAVLQMISDGTGWNKDLYSKVAAILASCDDVYSAEVPEALRSLAAEIADSEQRDEFLNMEVMESVKWLLSAHSGHAGKEFRKFIYRHGHRCVREAEFREIPWRQQPEKVVSVVRTIIETKAYTGGQKQYIDEDEAIEMLPTMFNPLKKWILRRVIRLARRGVGSREWGKSISIQFSDIFKQAFQRLGQLMHAENLIPDADLVYFFSYDELHSIVNGNNAALVAKALRRRQILPKQTATTYPELSQGYPPKPISDLDNESRTRARVEDGLTLSGMPVSRGEIDGRARVVCTLDEAASIEKGEILIVPYTDVGWSPYFPLISGLVTEMGGLLSHGAVVAREYGLPCVVGCHQATSTFCTGDFVRLNGTRGTIQRISEQ